MCEWLDATVLGSSYEQQINICTGEYRHRVQSLACIQGRLTPNLDTPWRRGLAPDSSKVFS